MNANIRSQRFTHTFGNIFRHPSGWAKCFGRSCICKVDSVFISFFVYFFGSLTTHIQRQVRHCHYSISVKPIIYASKMAMKRNANENTNLYFSRWNRIKQSVFMFWLNIGLRPAFASTSKGIITLICPKTRKLSVAKTDIPNLIGARRVRHCIISHNVCELEVFGSEESWTKL